MLVHKRVNTSDKFSIAIAIEFQASIIIKFRLL